MFSVPAHYQRIPCLFACVRALGARRTVAVVCSAVWLCLGCPAKPDARNHQRATPPGTAAQAGKPVAAVRGLSAEGALQPSPDDRCPVCAMRITAEKKLASAIELEDGTTYYFCGTGCLLRAWLHPERHLGVPRRSFSRVVTRDYFTGQPLSARRAVWVTGSDVVGPMGPAIVPLENPQAAATFRRRHGGTRQFTLDELTESLWQEIANPQATP